MEIKMTEGDKTLHAGLLSAEFKNGRLLNIRCGNTVIISEIYYALRDCNWGTVPYEITDYTVRQSEQTFFISFMAIHKKDGMKMHWSGKIKGTINSEILYEFEGEADEDFWKNRIGFCILHPAGLAGSKCSILHSDDQWQEGNFPYYISPHQPFYDVRAISYRIDNGITAEIRFSGDVFEMEDQRNWTDASFKTYCTPLELPFPVLVKKGEQFSQKIIVRCMKQGLQREEQTVLLKRKVIKKDSFFINECSIGSCIRKPLDDGQLSLIKMLHLGHFRYDYHFSSQNEGFEQIRKQINEMGSDLLLAIFFSDNWETEIKRVERLLESRTCPVRGILLLPENGNTLETSVLKQLIVRLTRFHVRIGSGTDAFFTQLNRERISADGLDFISYSNNPQVHAFDEESIVSTVIGQQANVISCRALYPEIPVVVSPVTLKMRWNPDATGSPIVIPRQVPDDTDVRQTSLFLASWTIYSASLLLQERVQAVTYYELTGSKGVIEDHVCKYDFAFPSSPDMIYPVYFAMMLLGYLQGAELSILQEVDITKIFWKKGLREGVIIANHTDRSRETDVNGQMILFDHVFMERLQHHFEDWYEVMTQSKTVINGRLKLPEYSVAFINFYNERG